MAVLIAAVVDMFALSVVRLDEVLKRVSVVLNI